MLKKPSMVKQTQLRDIVQKRVMLADLRTSVKACEEELERDTLLLIHALDHGAPVERGDLNAAIAEQAGARRPAWKEAFAMTCGADAVQRVINATEPGPTVRKLLVTERGVVAK